MEEADKVAGTRGLASGSPESEPARKDPLTSRQLTRIAFFVVLNIVTAQLCLTFWAIPLTMQTVSVRLAGYLLPTWDATLVQLTYVLMGLLGFPVFAGGGGLQSVLSPSFGYLLGFILMAPCMSFLSRRFNPENHYSRMLVIGVLTLPALFIPGVAYLKLILNLPWQKAVLGGFVAFLLPDLVKIVLSAALATRLKKLGSRFLR